MVLKEWIKRRTFIELMHWAFMIVIIAFVLSLILMQVDRIIQIDTNEKITGISMDNDEKKCYDICGRDNYYFSHGTLFASGECECGIK